MKKKKKKISKKVIKKKYRKKRIKHNPDVFSSDPGFMPPFVPASYQDEKSPAIFVVEKELQEAIKAMEKEIALSGIKVPVKKIKN